MNNEKEQTIQNNELLREDDLPFIVSDLKQWEYCPRILYYALCLPDVRPTTYKMQAGVEAGLEEEGREKRRSLHPYGLSEGRREFDVAVTSQRMGLKGKVDMVIWLENKNGIQEIIPVDFKLSKTCYTHFKLQLTAYGLLLEENSGIKVERGFIYFIPLRKAEEVRFTKPLRAKVLKAIEEMQRMLWSEVMPKATQQLGKCIICEFRRFCNDVL